MSETVKWLNGIFGDAKELISIASIIVTSAIAIAAVRATRMTNEIARRPYQINLLITAFWGTRDAGRIEPNPIHGRDLYVEIASIEGKSVHARTSSFLCSVPFVAKRFSLANVVGINGDSIVLSGGDSHIFKLFDDVELLRLADELPVKLFPRWRIARMKLSFRTPIGEERHIRLVKVDRSVLKSKLSNLPILYRL